MTGAPQTDDAGPLVSVIVPVYNVRDFVSECLASITAQTHSNMQIIVVDDGSSDGAGETCDQLAALDARIEVIHQANAGLSGARNAGLDRAAGEYLTLVDGDDVIAPEFVSRLLADCVSHDADLAVTGFATFTGQAPALPVADEVEVLRTPEELEQLVTGVPPRWEGPTKLYRAEAFEGLRFHEGVLYEDLELSPRLLARLHTAVVRSDRLYGYRQRPDSIMANTRRGISADLITVLDRTIATADAQFPPDAADRLRRAFLLHASKQLEYLPAGAAWFGSREFRRAHRRFVRRHARAIATDRQIASAYRLLMLLSGVSTTAFKGSFVLARWAKGHVPVDLRRQPEARPR